MRIPAEMAHAFREFRGMDELTDQLRAAGFLVGERGLVLDDDDLATVDENGDPLDIPAGARAIVAAYVPPAPVSTPAERLDALVAEGKPALEAATTLAEIKSVMGGILDGMRDIYGSGGA